MFKNIDRDKLPLYLIYLGLLTFTVYAGVEIAKGLIRPRAEPNIIDACAEACASRRQVMRLYDPISGCMCDGTPE